MTEGTIRLSKVIRELNVSMDHIIDFLKGQGIAVDRNPNAKITEAAYRELQNEFAQDRMEKEEAIKVTSTTRVRKESIVIDEEAPKADRRDRDGYSDEILIKDRNQTKATPEPKVKAKKAEEKKEEPKKPAAKRAPAKKRA